jgi:hypothetical protein
LQLKESKFFKVFEGHGFDIERRVRELLSRYVDFDFSIDLGAKKVSFSREITKEGSVSLSVANSLKALESLVFPTPL